MAEGIRFSPPAIDVSLEIDWLLARALGPVDLPFGGRVSLSLGELGSGARRLLISAVGRSPEAVLEEELSATSRRDLEGLLPRALASELVQERVGRELAEIASGMGMNLLFLKGLALRLGEFVEPGERPASDIDILVSPERASELYERLKERGFRSLGYPAKEQHLPTLVDPRGQAVEVHTILMGVRLCSASFVTIEDCEREGRAVALEKWPGRASIPDRDLLMAHLLVHALGQHGFSPEVYPQVQVLPDLRNLGFAGPAGERFLGEGLSWIEEEVSREEVEALRDLLRQFKRGRRASAIAKEDSDASRMLRHFLAGEGDADYPQSLKLDSLFRRTSADDGLLRTARSVKNALFLNRRQIEVIYGPPRTALGYLGWRLWRPFDLMLRAARTRFAARRLRGRNSS